MRQYEGEAEGLRVQVQRLMREREELLAAQARQNPPPGDWSYSQQETIPPGDRAYHQQENLPPGDRAYSQQEDLPPGDRAYSQQPDELPSRGE